MDATPVFQQTASPSGRLERNHRRGVAFATATTIALAMFRRFLRLCAPLAAFALIAIATPVAAQKTDPGPKPDTYLCPNATGGAVDCFLHAVEHLYTMCRQVKSIEIIEFGYEKSGDGVNGAKSEYCVDKHRLSITRPYQSALREATGSMSAVDGLRSMYDAWLKALADLKWKPGESDDQYKVRIAQPYEVFREGAMVVRASLPTGKPKAANAPAAAAPKRAN